jgi:hypothetical protein
VAETNKHPLKIQWKEPEQSQRTVIPLRDFVQPKKIPCSDKEASAARAIPSVRLTTTINGNMLHHELATEPVPKPHTAHRSAPATTRSLVGAVLYKTLAQSRDKPIDVGAGTTAALINTQRSARGSVTFRCCIP